MLFALSRSFSTFRMMRSRSGTLKHLSFRKQRTAMSFQVSFPSSWWLMENLTTPTCWLSVGLPVGTRNSCLISFISKLYNIVYRVAVATKDSKLSLPESPCSSCVIVWQKAHRGLLSLGAGVGLLSQQTVSKSQGNGKRTQPISHLASAKQIYNLLNQFLCNLLSSVCTQFVCSLLGHVTTVSPLGKPQKISQFTEPFVQSAFFQFAEQFDHSLLDSVNQKKTKLVY